jgi:hypothetical protein
VVLDGVEAIRNDADVRRLLAVSYLVRRDFARAWQCYREQSDERHLAEASRKRE